MGPIIAWMFVAVLAALGVLAVAGSSQNASGFRGFLGDLRRESSARSSGRHEAPELGQSDDAEREAVAERVAVAEPVADAEPVDMNIEEFFSLGQSSEPAYVSVEEIQEVLTRARGAAVRRIPILNR
jgi:hypothetical protein